MPEELNTTAIDTAPAVQPQPDYLDKVYTALKDNLQGFDKPPQQFRQSMKDSTYANKAYTALKDNLTGFDKTPEQFYQATGLSKKASGAGAGNTSTPSNIGGLTDLNSLPLTNNAADYAPVNGKAKQALVDNDTAIRQRRQKVVDDANVLLNKTYNKLDPETRAGWDTAMRYNANRSADVLREPSVEERSHQEFMKTNLGKVLGAAAYLGRSATKGSLQALKGAATLANDAFNGNSTLHVLNEAANDYVFDKADENTNMGLSKSDINRYETDKGVGANLIRGGGQLAEIAPVIAGGSATNAPKAMFFLQGLGQGKETIDALSHAGTEINPVVKKLYPYATGAVNGLLMGDLGEGLFGKIPVAARDGVVNTIAANALEKSAGKELTGEAFQDLLRSGAKTFAEKFQQTGIKALENYNTTVKDLGKLQVSNFLLKQAADKVNGTPVFNENLGTLAENLSKMATTEAPMFAAAGTAGEAAHLLMPHSSFKNEIVNSIVEDPSHENVDAIKKQLHDYGFDQNKGEDQWTPQQMDATYKQVDNIAKIAQSLPKGLDKAKASYAIDVINGRNKLQEDLNALMEQKKQLDPSMHEVVSPYEQNIADKIEQANDKLRAIATGKWPTYSKGTGDEEGKFYKTINGKKEEISESRYELENMERSSHAEANTSPVSEENPVDGQIHDLSTAPSTEPAISVPTEEETKAQREEVDNKIKDFQKKFPDHHVDLLEDLPESVVRTFDRVDNNLPTDPVAIKETSEWLYDKYKQLTKMKDSSTRRLTTEQIEGVQKQLGEDISTLENHLQQYHPDYERSETEAKNEPSTPVDTGAVSGAEAGQPEKITQVNEVNDISKETTVGETSPVIPEVPTEREPEKENSEAVSEINPVKKRAKPIEPIKNENTDARAEKAGIELEDTVGETRGDKVLNKEAQKAIKNGFDAHDLVDRILNENHQANDTEVAILAKHSDAIENRLKEINSQLEKEGGTLSKEKFAELVEERSRVANNLQDALQAQRKTGTITARALRARQAIVKSDYSLAGMIQRTREALGNDKLSSEKLAEVTKRFEELEKAQKSLEDKIEKQAKQIAELKIKKEQSEISAARRVRKSVSKEKLAEERQKIFSDLKADFAKIRKSGQAMSDIPYRRELAAVAKQIPAFLRNLAEEGIVELKDVVEKLKEGLRDELPDLTDSDYARLIAGEFNERRTTKTELSSQINSLKTQAKLVIRIGELEAGIKPSTTEKRKQETNKQIEALRGRLSALEKRNELSPEEKDLNAYKKRIQGKIEEIQQRIDNKDYDKPETKPATQLDREALEARRKYDKLKADFDLELEKDKLEQRTKLEKFKDDALNIISLPRALKATLDFSAPGRQGLILSLGHPAAAKIAMAEMFGQTFSEARYKNWLSDLKHSDLYELMDKSDLYISERDQPALLAREEQFTSNLAEKIPGFGKVVAGAERAYTAYLNVIRAQVFTAEAGKLLERGYTFEKNPEEFKSLAKVVNVFSGRGDIPEWLGGKQPAILSNALFSPRFMASRIQSLYLWADPRLTKNARLLAAKDIGKVLGTAATVLTLASLAGATVEHDPRSSDFLKMKFGNTRYDIMAGLTPYVVFLSQELTGKKKPTSNNGMITLNSGKFGSPTRATLAMNFLRGKLAPVPGIGYNLLEGKDLIGNDYDLTNVPQEFIPLPFTDVYDAYKVGGWKNSLEVLVPAQFGIGVSSYDANAKKSNHKHHHR